MNEIKLQYPAGIFSHSELAEFNKMDKLKILPAYKEAIANKVIVSMGSRKSASGRGRPTFLWKVNDGTVPTPVVEAVVVELPDVKPAVAPKVVVVTSVETLPKAEKVIEAATAMVEVIRIDPEPEATIDLPHVPNIVGELTRLSQVCPICKTPLFALADTTGVRVWCNVLEYSVCPTNENPEGHSNRNKDVNDAKTIVEAYETLCQKFSHIKA